MGSDDHTQLTPPPLTSPLFPLSPFPRLPPCSPAGGASAGGGGLAGLLSSILAAVRRELGPLLDACLAPGSALRGLDLLGAAVLDEVQGALAAALPGEGGRGGGRGRGRGREGGECGLRGST